eukprot:gene8520-47213_t
MHRPRSGVIHRWTSGSNTPGRGGVGTMVGDDGTKYFLCAPVLRQHGMLTQVADASHASGVATTVEEVVLEPRVWGFNARISRNKPGGDPEVFRIWRERELRPGETI